MQPVRYGIKAIADAVEPVNLAFDYLDAVVGILNQHG